MSAEHAGAPKISAWAQFKSVLSNKYWAMALALLAAADVLQYHQRHRCLLITASTFSETQNYVGMISVAERIPVVSATFLLPLVLKEIRQAQSVSVRRGRSHSLAFYRCILSDQCNNDHGCGESCAASVLHRSAASSSP